MQALLPWYGWLCVGVSGVALLLIAASRNFRGRVQRELVQFLSEEYPDFQVTGYRGKALLLRTPNGAEGTWNLDKIIKEIALLPNREDTIEKRREIFRHFANALLPQFLESDSPMVFSQVRDRILPRLVQPEWLASTPADADVPSVPIEGLDLLAVYVLDSPDAVRYLTGKDMTDLGLDLDELHELALENLRDRFPEDVIDRVLRGNNLVTVKCMDSYDATRLLVVPERLEGEDQLIALIPDRDTLTLLSTPTDEHWESVRELARVPSGDHALLNRPILVTRFGFRVL